MGNLRTSLMFLALVVSFGCGSPTRNSYTGNGNSGGGGSNPPPPVTSSVSITSLSPASVTAGNPDFILVIVGSGFPAIPLDYRDHPAVWWAPHGTANGVYLSVDNTQSDTNRVTATVPASQLQNAGDFDVQVQVWFKADDMPKAVSNLLKFSVSK